MLTDLGHRDDDVIIFVIRGVKRFLKGNIQQEWLENTTSKYRSDTYHIWAWWCGKFFVEFSPRELISGSGVLGALMLRCVLAALIWLS